jgi:hypothetical protein
MGKDNQLKDRTGEVSYTKYGTKATIIQYINRRKVLVEFDDDYKYQYYTSYPNFKNGMLTNPYECRSKNGIGFIGVGQYNSKEHKLAYHKWSAIIQRCIKTDYTDESLKSYKGCTICDEWLNFQNFAKWFYENYYECQEPLCVDKDILIHGNKHYSPETCLLVPQRINLLFIKEKGRRGDLVIGAQHHSSGNGYMSMLSTLNGNKYLGLFSNEIDAFNIYKEEKEKYIKEVADEYKSVIPDKLYDAMYRYEVKITD